LNPTDSPDSRSFKTDTEIAAANARIRDIYLPAHNARFARPAAVVESAFVKVADTAVLTETLCVQEERVVDRANTVSWGRLRLQLPQSPLRAHFVKARVRVHEYPDGALAVFHGPRCIARYTAQGEPTTEVPTCASVTPCSPPSRRGLSRAELVESAARRPSLTAAALGVTGPMQVGTKKTALRSNKETDPQEARASHSSLPLGATLGRGVHRFQTGQVTPTGSGQLMCYQNRTS
jgi:hypothetical protein